MIFVSCTHIACTLWRTDLHEHCQRYIRAWHLKKLIVCQLLISQCTWKWSEWIVSNRFSNDPDPSNSLRILGFDLQDQIEIGNYLIGNLNSNPIRHLSIKTALCSLKKTKDCLCSLVNRNIKLTIVQNFLTTTTIIPASLVSHF